MDIFNDENYLAHYGTPRHSGRYPWGSGDNPYQRNMDFLARYKEMSDKGMSDGDIATAMGISLTNLRQKKSAAREQERTYYINRAYKLAKKGMGASAIAKEMSTSEYPINESTVRGWLDAHAARERDMGKQLTSSVANELESIVKDKGYVDVGLGVERLMGVTQTKLKTALNILKEKGYTVENIYVDQVTMPGQKTTVQVLAMPGTTKMDIYNNMDQIAPVTTFFPLDDGVARKPQYPEHISSDRVYVRFAEEGGKDMDGVIEIRPGVPDLSLGKSAYAQVRIAVDDDKYLKGMALYSNDIPEGYDIVVNSNKSSEVGKSGAMKEMKKLKDGSIDKDNPFGAVIYADGQTMYTGADGKEHLGAVNKIKEQGDWDTYSKNLASQFLAKQGKTLAKRQLDIAHAERMEEFEEIMSIPNAALRKNLLASFADDCDAASADLKAAALPRQSTKVILPLTQLKDNEIYAPTYRDGEQVALVRYPHGGTFEIPILTVNNKNPQGKSMLADITDAVGIPPSAAERLSGADFDGDTAIVIPLSRTVHIESTPQLKGLVGYEPKELYATKLDPATGKYINKDGKAIKVMTEDMVPFQMGTVSNLITDMTIQGADTDEIARAVRHSMTVIDAKKHHLDYEQSFLDNNIASLQKKYQAHLNKKGDEIYGGASTLLSKAGANTYIDQQRKYYKLDEEGNKITEASGRTYRKYSRDKEGNLKLDENGDPIYKDIKRQDQVPRMYTVNDAYELSSGSQIESVYADYANSMKDLARKARLESQAISGKDYPVNKSAKEMYAVEVADLMTNTNIAEMNRPKERMAQIAANLEVKAKKEANGMMDKKQLKKEQQIALTNARARYGAKKSDVLVQITPEQWEAIQAGAVSFTQQQRIFKNTDQDELKKLAMPKATTAVSPAKASRMQAMKAGGYTIAQIADALGYSTSTVSKYLKEAS